MLMMMELMVLLRQFVVGKLVFIEKALTIKKEAACEVNWSNISHVLQPYVITGFLTQSRPEARQKEALHREPRRRSRD
jgi:hypothetical protein